VEICALQEVDSFTARCGHCDQLTVLLEILRERSGVHWEGVYAPAIPFDGGEYGIALVSRYQIEQASTVKIALPAEQKHEGGRFEDRVLLNARIRVGEKLLTVLNTHFGLMPAEQDLSVQAVADTLAKSEGALLLAGDFNVQPQDAHIEALCKMLTPAGDRGQLPLTYSSVHP
jgi:endonuclease/exonuclease/phosphatase family metal-dependent hydrolase